MYKQHAKIRLSKQAKQLTWESVECKDLRRGSAGVLSQIDQLRSIRNRAGRVSGATSRRRDGRGEAEGDGGGCADFEVADEGGLVGALELALEETGEFGVAGCGVAVGECYGVGLYGKIVVQFWSEDVEDEIRTVFRGCCTKI